MISLGRLTPSQMLPDGSTITLGIAPRDVILIQQLGVHTNLLRDETNDDRSQFA